MNAVAVSARICARTFKNRFSALVLPLILGVIPHYGFASSPNDRFQQYLFDLCNGNITAPPGTVWDTASLSTMCFDLGGLASAGGSVSANLGMANAGGGISSRQKKGIREQLEEQKEKPDKGASADGGSWGLLIAPQYSRTERPETDLENGYQSKLSGALIGIDYRFSDSLVVGGALGRTKDKATFLNSAGSLETVNDSFTMYGTWLPSQATTVGGYLGYGKTDFDSQRKVNIVVGLGGISGTTSSNTSGKQLMGGLSATFQKDIGPLSLAPFINVDYVKTRIDGYDESGTTTVELHYADRSMTSFTASLGSRLSSQHGYAWGALVPSIRLAAVHEFKNDPQQIKTELVSAPGSGFLVDTDAPDRNFLIAGFGVVAAINGGTQLFVDYEKRTRDTLLNNWAVSIGALLEF